jgi:hypothetical protein
LAAPDRSRRYPWVQTRPRRLEAVSRSLRLWSDWIHPARGRDTAITRQVSPGILTHTCTWGRRPRFRGHSYRRDGCCQPATGETFVARPAVRIGLAPGLGEVSCVIACAALRDPARRGGRGSARAASDQGRGRCVRPLAASRLSKPARGSGAQRCVPPPPAHRSAAWAPDARPHLVAAARLPKACGSRGSPARQPDGGVGTAGGQACEIGS